MLLLCSGSPRRQDFLRTLGLRFEVVPPGIDEARRPGEPVRAYVERLAREKALAGRAAWLSAPEKNLGTPYGFPAAAAAAAVDRHGAGAAESSGAGFSEKSAPTSSEALVALGADTIVVVGDEVLGKPRDRADARRMLALLSGSQHLVVTSVCVVADETRTATVETAVRFRTLSRRALDWLADSGDGDDKAGAYAVQGLAAAFVERIDGSLTSVVGLPLAETVALLEQAGIALPWSAAGAAR